MKTNFEDITYLKQGTMRQQAAYAVLQKNKTLLKLKKFTPILVGTIPINIDIQDSDLDIICYFSSQQEFEDIIKKNFKHEKGFEINTIDVIDGEAVVANFTVENFQIEIFGQNIPTKQQIAYRHMIIEYDLLNKYGENFRQQIIQLKRKGYKTEPAFCKALGIEGNPYLELLKCEI